MEPEVTSTPQLIKKPSHLRLYILITTFAVLSLVLLAFLVLSNQNTNTNSVTNQEPTQEIEEESNYPISFPEVINFVNEDKFEKSNITSFKSEECELPETLLYPVNIDKYTYKITSEHSALNSILENKDLSIFVSRNPRELVNDNEYQDTLYNLDLLFRGSERTDLNKLAFASKAFSRGCTTGYEMKSISHIKPNYPNSTFFIVSNGSWQSPGTKNSQRVQVDLFFKKGLDYAFSSISVNYNDIVEFNNLHVCEKNPGTNEIIEDRCVSEVLSQDINNPKLDEIIAEWLKIFELD